MFVGEEISPWLYFAAVLVQILIAVCSSSDAEAALRLKHLALTPMQYDPLLTCSWCGSSWQHLTPPIVPPPLPTPFLKQAAAKAIGYAAGKGAWQRLSVDLSNAQMSLIYNVQLSSELGNPKNGEVQVVLGS